MMATKPTPVKKPVAKPASIPTGAAMAEKASYQNPVAPITTAAPVVKETTVFTPVKEIVDRYGDVVRVDNQGRDESGNIVFAGPDQSKVGGSPNTSVNAPAVATTPVPAGVAIQQDNSKRQSAYDLLYQQFKNYGLESLVEPLKGLITDAGVSPAEFTIRLRDTDAYKKRFAANQSRIQKGLTALSEAEYLGMEDQYQNLMRNYGLPASYYAKGDLGRQEGFEKLIASDVSAAELEDRIATAQQRVLNTNPEVLKALKQFYPDLGNADILAYTLDPEKGLADIKRKVTAAEIGGAALAQGLQTGQASAEALAGYGVTKQQAQEGYQTVAELAPRGSQLASIYGQTPYTQQTAEAEVFGTAGAAEATKQRKKLKALEEASFGGQSGVGALGRDRVAYSQQTYGAGQY